MKSEGDPAREALASFVTPHSGGSIGSGGIGYSPMQTGTAALDVRVLQHDGSPAAWALLCIRGEQWEPDPDDSGAMAGTAWQAFVRADEHGLLVPRWNIAPTQKAPVIRVGDDGRRRLDLLRWGLVPSWAKDLKFGARCVNARVETAATKPAFRAAWKSRRCFVPASGFYEWTATRPKEAWFFRAAGGTPLFFAGLWETWTDQATGEVVEHAAVGHVVGDAEAARTIGTS